MCVQMNLEGRKRAMQRNKIEFDDQKRKAAEFKAARAAKLAAAK